MIKKILALDVFSIRKGAIPSLLVVAILSLVMGAFHPIYMIPISVFFCFSISPFEVEEKGNLHYLYLSMPISRRALVVARFILSLIMFLVGVLMGRLFISIIGLISVYVSFMVQPAISFSGYLAIIVFSYLLFALLSLFAFPVMFTFGYAKGKFAVYGSYIPLMFIFMILSAWDWSTTLSERRAESPSPIVRLIEYSSENFIIMGIGLFVVATIILFISYLLSLRGHMRRDF